MGRRCLVIGAAGQLGRALCAAFCEAGHEVIRTVHRASEPGQMALDLEAPEEALVTIRRLQPEWILIAGAFCNVDAAETERARCVQVNVETPRLIATYAHASGCRVVYYSTDQVFDGASEFYQETDSINPLNAYARSKAQGEAAIRLAMPNAHLILRTAWLYGPDVARRNFPLRLVDQLSQGRNMAVPLDQSGCPTYTEDLAVVTRVLLEHDCVGTFHVTGPDLIDRVALARRVCARFELDPGGIVPTLTSQLGQAAMRPRRVHLNGAQLQAAGAGPLKGVEEGLAALYRWYVRSEKVVR